MVFDDPGMTLNILQIAPFFKSVIGRFGLNSNNNFVNENYEVINILGNKRMHLLIDRFLSHNRVLVENFGFHTVNKFGPRQFKMQVKLPF